MGHECGLRTTEECVNNVLYHACNLFAYEDIPKEAEELVQGASAAGIEFQECGCAKM